MAAIEISGVRKSFGTTPVLKGIDLAIRSGEFVVLVGPSGCGKSTLLRLIAGLEELSSGEIRIGDVRVNDLPPKDRDIAMVFQSYALYPHMNVADNMSYSLRLRRTPREKIAAAVKQAADMLGLQALQERKPRALSGGQRQRVAMGRAIVRTPKAFLFDEPLSNLDARLREQMRFEIRKLHRELGATSVYVTHDQIEAMTMADRIVAMDGGIVQQVGTPLELYDDPANIFVAGFIGSPAMNFIDAVATPAGDRLEVRAGDVLLATLPRSSTISISGKVVAAVRPERIALESKGTMGVAAVADLVEPTGLGTVVHLSLAGQPIKLFTTERPSLAVNEPVELKIFASDVRLFSAPDGKRLC
jgi:multiple sugar transport system ATP-binding protein